MRAATAQRPPIEKHHPLLKPSVRLMIRFDHRVTSAPELRFHLVRRVIGGALILMLLASAGCANSRWASVRKTPYNPLAGPLQLVSRSGPQVTERTRQSLRQLGMEKYAEGAYEKALPELAQVIEYEPTADNLYTFAEVSYVAANRAEALGKQASALELYAGSVAHAYRYLFECEQGEQADQAEQQEER